MINLLALSPAVCPLLLPSSTSPPFLPHQITSFSSIFVLFHPIKLLMSFYPYILAKLMVKRSGSNERKWREEREREGKREGRRSRGGEWGKRGIGSSHPIPPSPHPLAFSSSSFPYFFFLFHPSHHHPHPSPTWISSLRRVSSIGVHGSFRFPPVLLIPSSSSFIHPLPFIPSSSCSPFILISSLTLFRSKYVFCNSDVPVPLAEGKKE